VHAPPQVPLSAAEIGSAVVDCGLYEGGERLGGRIELESALRKADACQHGFVWIGLHDPSPGVVEAVGEHFELHPLAVEDAVHAHQRAKLEVHGNTLFVVLKTARYVDSDELIEIGEVMVFLGERFVVTVRHGEGSPLHDVRLDLEAHPDLLGIGPSSVLYAIADRIVDDYLAVIDGIAVDVEEVEAEVFSGASSNPAERIYRLKREVLEFRRAVTPLIAPMQRLSSKQAGLPLDPRTEEYFRDVHDHLLRDAERIAGFDELLTNALQANVAQITMRDNQDMRRISAWVAIIAVPTMVFGLYGMNFEHMPELKWTYGYPLVVAVVLAICAVLYRKFKQTGWL
jgi:magnesium transporter